MIRYSNLMGQKPANLIDIEQMLWGDHEGNVDEDNNEDQLDDTGGNSEATTGQTSKGTTGKNTKRSRDKITPTRGPSSCKKGAVRTFGAMSLSPTKQSTQSKRTTSKTDQKVKPLVLTHSSQAEQLMEYTLLSHYRFMADEEVHIQIWDGWGHPTNVTFKSNKDNAGMDIPYLKKIMANTEEHYIDGKPLHCHPDTRNRDAQHSSSSIFIIEAKDFRQMTPNEVQEIFCDRHILVLDVESNQDWSFNEECLNHLGPIDQERQMQAHKKTVDDPESILVKGTFQDLIDVANENYTAVFNVLDIPMGDSSGVDIPPSYLHIASEE
ncbi:hypothetical protein FIBSPDRAFT_885813 [Athelia psychrophila]|uniref:Uncharacterized protein n=1 Tax=Athelia psychrophila TaxID=1759441 RepID=A0A166RFI8_9AGAM|nr:hypothetical protein FIBSPDRAFT_885813 [Fibularhizoctonia sp. CBS 109695]